MMNRVRAARMAAVAMACFLPLAALSATVAKEDRERYLAAVEDYRFSDLESAISALEALRARYPKDADILRYLALSYEESKRFSKAADVYGGWLAVAGMRLTSDMREAWMGYVRSLAGAGRMAKALDVLEQWLNVHGKDAEALVLYGDLLVREKRRADADRVWRNLLAQPQAAPVYRAAAHYYLALSAYRSGDFAAAREQAGAALNTAPESPYAPAAKRLMQVRSTMRREGWSGNVLLGEFYTSNVELLPDVVNPPAGKKKSDAFTELDLTLAWQGGDWRVGYAFNSQWHASRRDFDMNIHMLLLDKNYLDWTFSPRFEYVVLNKQRLYYGGGLDVSWRNAGWMVRWQGRYRSFSRAFGALRSDLGRLSGFSNEINVMRQWKLNGGDVLLIGAHAHLENTRGDLTHPKTDDYMQIGVNASWTGVWRKMDTGLFAMGYWRRYAKADTTILVSGASARRDWHLRVGGHLAWRPFGRANNRVVLQGHYQKNMSNYKAPVVVPQFGKAFTEWQGGVSWQYLW